jgi:hypothetical protein
MANEYSTATYRDVYLARKQAENKPQVTVAETRLDDEAPRKADTFSAWPENK